MRSPSRPSVVAVVLASLLAGFPAASAQSRQTTEISVPSQSLADAISQLAEQTDITIYAPSRLLADKISAPVSGLLSAGQALDAMLKGTGLEASLSNGGAYILRPRGVEPVRRPEAAQPSDPTRAVIVVTGDYSGGLDRALDLKRRAHSTSDAVVAADIGKLPAVNVAEALQRLPGVTISREAGEGEFVGVRGLGPNFQSVTFNGIPIAVNENIRNSDQSGRQFRFRVLPADLLGAVVVTKSPTADLVDGGIGANVDIKSVRALDRGSFASGRIYAGLDERTGGVMPNASFSAGWVDAQDTLGFTGGASFQRRSVQFDRLQTFGYQTFDIGGLEDVHVADGWNTTVEEEERRRISMLGGVQWRPSERLEVRGDVLYAAFNNQIAENRISYDLGDNVLDGLVPGSARVQDGVLYAAALESGQIYRSAEYSEQAHRNISLSLGADVQHAGWTISSTVSFSQATSDLDVPLQRIESRTEDGQSASYRFDLGSAPLEEGRIPLLQTDMDLTDADATTFHRYRIRPVNSKDLDGNFLLDVERSIDGGWRGLRWTDLRLGLQHTARMRDYQRRDRTLSLRDGYQVNSSYYGYGLPRDAFEGLINQRSVWSGPDLHAFRRAFEVAGEYAGVEPQSEDLRPTGDDLRQSYRIEEEIIALYGRIDFAGAVREIPMSGNLGVRWVDTQTTVFGALVTAEAGGAHGVEIVAAPRQTQGRYEVALPSLNLAFDLRDDLLLRLAASRSMTRPSLASLRDATVPNSSTVSTIFERGAAALEDPNLNVSGVGGNPRLRPYVSTNFDASLEWYFEEFGALTAALFHKRIDNFIADEPRWETLPFAVHDGGVVLLDVLVNRPQNIGEAEISGLELGYSVRLSNGFGLSTAATLTSSSVELDLRDGRESAALQGVSEVSYSIVPFVERGPFEAHLSYTWRSEFVSNGNVTIASDARADPQNSVMAAGFGTLDFGASYRMSDRISLFAEGVNLTDTRQGAWQGSKAMLYQLHQYGRTLNLGVRAEF